MGLFIIGLNPVPLHKAADDPQDFLILLHSQQTILVFNNIVSPSGVKSSYDLPILIQSKGKLGLVPIAPRILHPHDWKHGDLFFPESSDPHKVIFDLALLKYQLFLVFHELKLTAPAGTGSRTTRLCPDRRRFNNLHEPCKTVGFLHFHGPGPNPVADNRILDKPDITVQFPDSGPVLAHIFNGNCKFLILFHCFTPLFF